MRAVNLLPRIETRRKSPGSAVLTQAAIASPLIVVALLGALYLVNSSKVSDRRGTLQALQDEIAALPPPKPPVQIDQTLVQQHELRVGALADALRSRIAWDRILRQVSSVLPEDVWLTALTAQPPGEAAPATPAPATPAPATEEGTTTTAPAAPAPAPAAAPTGGLSLEGYTYSQEGVARFLSRLGVIPELSDVKLVSSERTAVLGRIVVRFSITAAILKQEAA
jgi:Tfp pilus assembly protein PilN